MNGDYINFHVKAEGPVPVRESVARLFSDFGFDPVGHERAASVVEDDDKLPDGEDWYGVIVSTSAPSGWVSVYVEDWQDSGVLAKGVSRLLEAPVLEIWVAAEANWGYTYYENGIVLDRFADDPAKVAATAAEAATLTGQSATLAPVLMGHAAPTDLDRVLREAQANVGEFVGPALDGLAGAVGLPFEHILTSYETLFEDDPGDYGPELEHWPEWVHLAFRHPQGKDHLSE